MKDLKYRPVFVGHTEEGEKIVLYADPQNTDQIHILRPDGGLWAIEPGAKFRMHFNLVDSESMVEIESEVWTGRATGSKKELQEEPNR